MTPIFEKGSSSCRQTSYSHSDIEFVVLLCMYGVRDSHPLRCMRLFDFHVLRKSIERACSLAQHLWGMCV